MTQIVFLLEEPSAREMLMGLIPRLISPQIHIEYLVFEGKRDLEKRMPRRLKAWQRPGVRFVVLRDQDSGDCRKIKAGLAEKCAASGKPDTLIRIACRELEAFYLGDLTAVADAIGPANLGRQQNKAKYRNPDRLGNPAQELKRIAPAYQKVAGSRAIGPRLSIDGNRSHSFNVLARGIRSLT